MYNFPPSIGHLISNLVVLCFCSHWYVVCGNELVVGGSWTTTQSTPHINDTLLYRKNNENKSSSDSNENLRTIIILLLCILIALIIFVLIHFYLTLKRTYTGVFVPRHNFVPANPSDMTWIYEHIDRVPIIISTGSKNGKRPPRGRLGLERITNV